MDRRHPKTRTRIPACIHNISVCEEGMRMVGSLIDQRFGYWVVLYRDSNRNDYYVCRCDCGTIKSVYGYALRKGLSKSCGCRRFESKYDDEYGRDCRRRAYTKWQGMMRRCYDQKHTRYHTYGGRGIQVCDDWHDFDRFYEWLISQGYNNDLSLTIERIDNNKGYNPSNCILIPLSEQCNNKTTSHFIEYNGEIHTMTQWAKIKGINVFTLKKRLESGYSIDDALNKPVEYKGPILLECDGISKSMKDWAKELGVPAQYISMWNKKGYSVKDMKGRSEKLHKKWQGDA